jgi:Glycosyl transferase family 2
MIASYRLRLWRKRLLWRAWSRRRDMVSVMDRAAAIKPKAILLFAAMRNERVRLPYFLQYYRNLGVDHFLIVDNDSTDGTHEYLVDQPDVSLWSAKSSYKRASYGVDWLNWLKRIHGNGHWCLTVDCDEFLIYPFCETRPLRALTDWLDASSVRSMSAMALDMYPKGRIDAEPYREGQDPFAIAGWFDSGNYMISKNSVLGNLWIQGGPRARVMFADQPANAPALNKTPLVKWQRGNAYVSSTHMILPRGLNTVYEENGGEKVCGCLLHAKFLDTFTPKAQEEMSRREHHANSQEYSAYLAAIEAHPDLWCKWSEKFVNWRQLEILGLMSKGTWA